MLDAIRAFNISLMAAGSEHFQLQFGAGIIQPSDKETCRQSCGYETWDEQIFYLYNELIKN